MSAPRLILPGGAPAELWEFFRAHPNSNIDDAIKELKLHRSTAFYALSRLFELELIEQFGKRRKGQRRTWKVVEQSAPPPAQPLASALPLSTPRLVRAHGVLQPTGMPYQIIEGKICPIDGRCALQVFAIRGTGEKPESNYAGRPGHQINADSHPWKPHAKAA